MKAARWIWKVVRQVSENDLQNHAAEMAYFAMMAVFPFFLLLTTVVAFLPVPDLFQETMNLLREMSAPDEVIRLLEDTIREVTETRKTQLLSATLIVCVWMASGAMSSTTRGLNKAFGLKDPRHYARFFGLSLLMTLMLGLLLILGIIVILLGPRIQEFVFDYVDLGTVGETAFGILRNLLPLFFLFVVHAGIYWLCPAVRKKFRIFSPGTLFSVTMWILVSVGFKLYLEQVNNYDKLYGSLGAVILCLVWFYMMSFVLLIGGQIDAVLHPEYKAAVRDDGPREKEPLPWKLIGISVAILVLVPLGIRRFVKPAIFTPAAQDVGGNLSDLIKKGKSEGTERFSNISFKRVLESHVDENGRVDYAALSEGMDELNGYLEKIARADLSRIKSEDIQALLVNLYNASALKLVAENQAGLRSLRDLKDPFLRPVAKLGGREVSLVNIRDGILRVHFADDPRLLCALCDLTANGPKLQRFAYEGSLLEKQLEQVTQELLQPPQTTSDAGVLKLPFVFARFRPAFETAAADGTLKSFIMSYIDSDARKLLDDKSTSDIEFHPTNNALNRR